MSLEEVKRALVSLEGFPGKIGCMGGEPTLHPDFDTICYLYQKHFPRYKCGLWTSGGKKFEEHKNLIRETFGTLLYNDHSETGKHQPWMIAIEECVEDEETRRDLIDRCWVQDKWSPAINPKGAFFCEFAAVFDLLFDGPGGYPVQPGWWKKIPEDFQDQVDRYCKLCSAPLPFPQVKNNSEIEYVSPGNASRLMKIESPWAIKGKLGIVSEIYSREDLIRAITQRGYSPWEYLGDKGTRDKNGVIVSGYAKKRDHQALSCPTT